MRGRSRSRCLPASGRSNPGERCSRPGRMPHRSPAASADDARSDRQPARRSAGTRPVAGGADRRGQFRGATRPALMIEPVRLPRDISGLRSSCRQREPTRQPESRSIPGACHGIVLRHRCPGQPGPLVSACTSVEPVAGGGVVAQPVSGQRSLHVESLGPLDQFGSSTLLGGSVGWSRLQGSMGPCSR